MDVVVWNAIFILMISCNSVPEIFAIRVWVYTVVWSGTEFRGVGQSPERTSAARAYSRMNCGLLLQGRTDARGQY